MNAEEKLLEAGYEDVKIFKNFSYDSALIGVSEDNRAIYNFELMVEYLMETQGWTEVESIEWIEVNTLRSLPCEGGSAPIVMYPLSE